MNQELGPLAVIRKTGEELFYKAGIATNIRLLEFWQWSSSNLIDNTFRGILAEFIVAKALKISTDGVRQNWENWDSSTSSGIKIEAKSSAFIQAWAQKRLSEVQFVVRKRRA